MTITSDIDKTRFYENLVVFPVRGLGPKTEGGKPRGVVYSMMAVWQDNSGFYPASSNNWRLGEVWGPNTEGEYTPVDSGVRFDAESYHEGYELIVGETTPTTMLIALGEFGNAPIEALGYLTENQRKHIGSAGVGTTAGGVPDAIRRAMLGAAGAESETSGDLGSMVEGAAQILGEALQDVLGRELIMSSTVTVDGLTDGEKNYVLGLGQSVEIVGDALVKTALARREQTVASMITQLGVTFNAEGGLSDRDETRVGNALGTLSRLSCEMDIL